MNVCHTRKAHIEKGLPPRKIALFTWHSQDHVTMLFVQMPRHGLCCRPRGTLRQGKHEGRQSRQAFVCTDIRVQTSTIALWYRKIGVSGGMNNLELVQFRIRRNTSTRV